MTSVAPFRSPPGSDCRIPVLYLAPWVDFGGSDKGTIDWFRWLDRTRFRPILVTTQPSPNRRISEISPLAAEVWPLPELVEGQEMLPFILDLVRERGIRVVHVMNSRLAFDSLPDLALLESAPRIVVQLHVEEPSRTGYVRYVTTRYGNLVDAFSVTSEHLARAVHGYGIPSGKIKVIYTGVDAQHEFHPSRVEPVDVDPDLSHVLVPGRLVEQKDPLLAVEVISQVVRIHRDVCFHFVGDGHLESAVRERVSNLGLERHVRIHLPTQEPQRWYAACDAMLMTSIFEGIPFVVFEAMAMALPTVAPSLPGNIEALGGGGGVLIRDRTNVSAYSDALVRLCRDSGFRQEMGMVARERVIARFPIAEMGAAHSRLYEELLPAVAQSTGERAEGRNSPSPIRLGGRLPGERPLVSVIVPCFNHGQYIRNCIGSIKQQTYRHLQVIVIDDGSSDPHTGEVLQSLACESRIEVIRLAQNRGPSAARNAGIKRARGRYVLFVDADNILLPTAVERLVEQLSEAGENVGFIYPQMRFFGNSDVVGPALPYNLAELLNQNYCDTCSLFDAEIFEHDIEFNERIRLGHEDWDLVLQLAEVGIVGEPATVETVLTRKRGFTRSDLIDLGMGGFPEIRAFRSTLYAKEVAIQARWHPALALVALSDVDWRRPTGERLLRRLQNQTVSAFQFIAASTTDPPSLWEAPVVRGLPAELMQDPAESFAWGLEHTHAPIIAATQGDGSELLADSCFVQRVLQAFRSRPELDGIALAPAHPREVPFGRLEPEWERDPAAVAIRRDRLPASISLRSSDVVSSMVRTLACAKLNVEWRHGGRPAASGAAEKDPPRYVRASTSRLEWDTVSGGRAARVPAGKALLTRFRQEDGPVRLVAAGGLPPPGFELEHEIGLVSTLSPPGTVKVVQAIDGTFRSVTPGATGLMDARDRVIGHVELGAFALLDPLFVGALRSTGHHTLVNGVDDPLLGEVDLLDLLGYIDAWPLRPRHPVLRPLTCGLVGLVKTLDRSRRCHRYGIADLPDGEFVCELGAMCTDPQPGSIAAWILPDGRLITESYVPAVPPPGLIQTARWVAAPARWWGARRALARVRSIGRRALLVSRYRHGRPCEAQDGALPTFLLAEGGAGRLPLFSGVHPVSGDQLLTHYPLEAQDMGYVDLMLIGHLIAVGPLTGSTAPRRVSVPWASRFGLEARWA